jgi:hypothetical protein
MLSRCMMSAVAVYLRAGWSLGNVQDRYIFSGAGSDQVVGRAESVDYQFKTNHLLHFHLISNLKILT